MITVLGILIVALAIAAWLIWLERHRPNHAGPFGPMQVLLSVALTIAAGLIWLERRLLALWRDRYGAVQVLADGIKTFGIAKP